MSILIREYLGYSGFEEETHIIEQMNIKEKLAECDPVSPHALLVDIEGIHVGATRNFTRYMPSALQSSVKSWTHPYRKPLIMHHNEKDGKIIGRIDSAYYTDKNTRSGTGALVFVTNVPDKEGQEQIEDGRLLTTSIGIIGHDVRCSICEHNIADQGPCEHERGQVYDNQICYWDIYEMEGKELSYVIVPSDRYAKNIRVYRPQQKQAEFKEGLNFIEGVSKTMALTEAEIQKMQDDLTALQEANATLAAEKEQLETDLATAKADLTEAQTAKATTEQALNSLKESIGETELEALKEEKTKLENELIEAQGNLATVKNDLTVKSTELTQEKELREAAETQAIEVKTAMKQALVENYVILRKLSGKDVDMKLIQERTQESLCDGIKDIKEEMGEGFDIATIKLTNNPTLIENLEDSVKKGKKDSNIDLQEGLEKLFDAVTSKHYKN